MTSRGSYRALYSVLLDDPEYQRLTSSSRLLLLTLRLCHQAGPGSIFRYYMEVLREQTGLSTEELLAAFDELRAAGYIDHEAPVVWVVRGLRFDPFIRLSNPVQRRMVEFSLEGLPNSGVVVRFRKFYKLNQHPRGAGPQRGGGSGPQAVGDLGPQLPSPSPSPALVSVSKTREKEAAEKEGFGPPELVKLYNEQTPDNVPAVEVLSEKRREKARRALRQYPDRGWWDEVFVQYRRSKFLSGRVPPRDGHGKFRPDFDWLLSNGKNGVENYVKVHDGMYGDD